MLFDTRPTYTIIHEGNTMLDGMEAFEHIYMAETSNEVLMKTMQLYVATNSTAWVLSCGCGSECWGQYESVFDTVVYSLRFLD